MSKPNWRNVGEAIGLVSVVASLIFVGVQLRQDQVLARSELGSTTFELMVVAAQTMNDKEFSVIYAKMLQSPGQLSVEEMIRINAFLRQVSDAMARECYLVQRGVYVECDNLLRDSIRRYFGNAYAQAWWKLSDTRSEIELPDWVDAAIYKTGADIDLERIKAIQAEVSKENQ